MKTKENISIAEFDVPPHLATIYIVGLQKEYLGVPLLGRALRYNLFVRSSQKGFPLQSLTQNPA